ncbi:MAG: glycosyltransferase family protein [Candidatus Staskawiczbacteria bacterium]|nr:glycosyltransferase family protein [Candidatus Staskawiczbacteria bacterium]
MKIVAIIQARMGSTRLPGKMMLKILGKPIIEHVFERIKDSQLINEIWLATTLNAEDNVLADWADSKGKKVYRGSSDDVLERYWQTAKQAGADIVVRITGDCPLHDSEVIDSVINKFLSGGFDYVSNAHPPTYPDGLDTEVFSFQALEKSWEEAKLKSEKEHVTPYIWKNSEKFKIDNVSNEIDLSKERWTLDTKEDFLFIDNILKECATRGVKVNFKNVLDILESFPHWREINSVYQRNEGYQKSINEDFKEI